MKELFKIMNDLGYSYVDGRLRGNENYFDFSTGYNGRGNAVFVRLSDNNNDLSIFIRDNKPLEFKNISDGELLVQIHINVK